MMFLISFEIKVRTCSIGKKNKPDQSFSLQKEIFFLRCENVINKIIYKITIKFILIHEYQRKSTQIDTSPTRVNTNRVRHEPTRINTSLTRVNTSSARVITNQRESNRSQHESDRIQTESTRVQNRSKSDSSQNLRLIKTWSITF